MTEYPTHTGSPTTSNYEIPDRKNRRRPWCRARASNRAGSPEAKKIVRFNYSKRDETLLEAGRRLLKLKRLRLTLVF